MRHWWKKKKEQAWGYWCQWLEDGSFVARTMPVGIAWWQQEETRWEPMDSVLDAADESIGCGWVRMLCASPLPQSCIATTSTLHRHYLNPASLLPQPCIANTLLHHYIFQHIASLFTASLFSSHRITVLLNTSLPQSITILLNALQFFSSDSVALSLTRAPRLALRRWGAVASSRKEWARTVDQICHPHWALSALTDAYSLWIRCAQ